MRKSIFILAVTNVLTLLYPSVVYAGLNSFNKVVFTAGSATPSHSSQSSRRLSKNQCDELIDRGASERLIANCFEQHGKSPYRQNIERIEREQNQAITRKVFDLEDLKDFFSGGVVIARISDSKGKVQNSTDPDSLCQHLGFQKAEIIETYRDTVNANDLRGEGFLIERRSWVGRIFNSRNYRKNIWTKDNSSRRSYYAHVINSITCVKSSMRNNPKFDEINLTERTVRGRYTIGQNSNRSDSTSLQTGQADRNDVGVNNDGRRSPALETPLHPNRDDTYNNLGNMGRRR